MKRITSSISLVLAILLSAVGLFITLSSILASSAEPEDIEYLLSGAGLVPARLDVSQAGAAEAGGLDSIDGYLEAIDSISGDDELEPEYYRSMLSGDTLSAYDLMKKALIRKTDKIPAGGTGLTTETAKELGYATGYVLLDHPEIFWSGYYVERACDYTYTEYADDPKRKSELIDVFPILKEKQEDIEAHQKQIDECVTEALTEVPEGSGQYKTAYYICRWLAHNVEYIWDDDFDESPYQDMLNTFAERRTVCAGYAHAFAYMCHEAGISCQVMTGMGTNFFGEAEEHAWCIFNANGVNYYCDPTWADMGDWMTLREFGIPVDERFGGSLAKSFSDTHEFRLLIEDARTEDEAAEQEKQK